jgi:hypothetical protein
MISLRNSKRFSFVLIFLFAASGLFSEDIGNFTIPVAVLAGETKIQPGLYSIHAEEESTQQYIQLTKSKKMIARVRAIVLPANGTGESMIEQIKVARKEFVRIRARHGDHWYFAYLEKAP